MLGNTQNDLSVRIHLATCVLVLLCIAVVIWLLGVPVDQWVAEFVKDYY